MVPNGSFPATFPCFRCTTTTARPVGRLHYKYCAWAPVPLPRCIFFGMVTFDLIDHSEIISEQWSSLTYTTRLNASCCHASGLKKSRPKRANHSRVAPLAIITPSVARFHSILWAGPVPPDSLSTHVQAHERADITFSTRDGGGGRNHRARPPPVAVGPQPPRTDKTSCWGTHHRRGAPAKSSQELARTYSFSLFSCFHPTAPRTLSRYNTSARADKPTIQSPSPPPAAPWPPIRSETRFRRCRICSGGGRAWPEMAP